MQLDQVKAVITGGVSGLGFAVAQHLVAHGAKVALFDINDEKGACGRVRRSAPQPVISAPTSPTKTASPQR